MVAHELLECVLFRPDDSWPTRRNLELKNFFFSPDRTKYCRDCPRLGSKYYQTLTWASWPVAFSPPAVMYVFVKYSRISTLKLHPVKFRIKMLCRSFPIFFHVGKAARHKASLSSLNQRHNLKEVCHHYLRHIHNLGIFICHQVKNFGRYPRHGCIM